MRYSKSTGGFYDPVIHSSIPEDAVEVSENDYRRLMSAQSVGKRIAPDSKGRPVAVDAPAPSAEEVQKALQDAAKSELQSSDIVVLKAYEDGKPVPKEWVAYRRKLRDVVNSTSATMPTRPEI